jgi:hypothetical protein
MTKSTEYSKTYLNNYLKNSNTNNSELSAFMQYREKCKHPSNNNLIVPLRRDKSATKMEVVDTLQLINKAFKNDQPSSMTSRQTFASTNQPSIQP